MIKFNLKPRKTESPVAAEVDLNKSLTPDEMPLNGHATAEPLPEKAAQPKRVRRFPWLRLTFLTGLAFVTGGGAAIYNGLQLMEQALPDTTIVMTFVRDGTLTIKASDGSTILQQLGPATRDELKFTAIPPQLLQSFIASEDRRFYQHDGVDYYGILRAIFNNLEAGELREGGSSITQQLARIVFLTQERSVWRKLKEALLARKIEQNLSKQQILERYLNLVYLGSGAYGVADAAWVYFSKRVDQLTLPEMAMIAGLAPAPSLYSPLVNSNAARVRRNLVLQRMEEDGYITPAQSRAAQNSPLNLKPRLPKRLNIEAPYFTTYIQQELLKYVSAEQIEIGGLTVETTINTTWQTIAQQVVQEIVREEGAGQGFEQAALVAIDPHTGEVKALVGGTSFSDSQFNRATQALRQPGSTFKTLVYATAIEAGFSPYNSYVDAPYRIDGYEPQNASRKFSGSMSMREALAQSINVIAVKVLVDIGFEPVLEISRRMGIQSELRPTYSLALGASEVNLLELTSAYGSFAAAGKHNPAHGIRRVINHKGEVIFDAKSLKPVQAVDKSTAAIITWILEAVVQSGTGGNAQLDDRRVAGKTGTSEQARDLWFIGYIPQVVVGVWLGNDNNDPTWGASSTAAYAWRKFMAQIVKGMPVQEFPPLPNLEDRKPLIKAKPIQGNVTAAKGRSEEEKPNKPQSNTRKPESNPDENVPGARRRDADNDPTNAKPADTRSSPANEPLKPEEPTAPASGPPSTEPAPAAPPSAPEPELPPAEPAPPPAPAPMAPPPAPGAAPP